MTRRTAERDLKTGKAAAACCVYEESGQGSVEEGAWRDRGRAVSRTWTQAMRGGQAQRHSSRLCVSTLVRRFETCVPSQWNAWTCLTKETEQRVNLEDEAGSGQIARCASAWLPKVVASSKPSLPTLLSYGQPCSCCSSPSIGPAFSALNTVLTRTALSFFFLSRLSS